MRPGPRARRAAGRAAASRRRRARVPARRSAASARGEERRAAQPGGERRAGRGRRRARPLAAGAWRAVTRARAAASAERSLAADGRRRGSWPAPPRSTLGAAAAARSRSSARPRRRSPREIRTTAAIPPAPSPIRLADGRRDDQPAGARSSSHTLRRRCMTAPSPHRSHGQARAQKRRTCPFWMWKPCLSRFVQVSRWCDSCSGCPGASGVAVAHVRRGEL